VANLKLCFNIVRGHDEKTATKLPFKLMAISNSSSLKQPAFHWRFTAHSYTRPEYIQFLNIYSNNRGKIKAITKTRDTMV
jgi:hypothetical protein